MENAPLKSSLEAGLDRKGESRPRDPNKLESSIDIAMRKADLIMQEAKSEEDAAGKLEELAKKSGLDISKSIEEKRVKIKELTTEIEALGEKEESSPAQEDNNKEEKNFSKIQSEALSDFVQSLRKGGKKTKPESAINQKPEKITDKKSSEASKIDNIMRGENRSSEAKKIDELMEKAMDKKVEKSDFQLEMEKPTNLNDLIDVLGQIGTINGQDKEDIRQIVGLMFKNKNKGYLKFLPDKFGIPENVERVYDLMQKEKEENKKAVA